MDKAKKKRLSQDGMQSTSNNSESSVDRNSPSHIDSGLVNVQDNAKPDSFMNQLIYKPQMNYRR